MNKGPWRDSSAERAYRASLGSKPVDKMPLLQVRVNLDTLQDLTTLLPVVQRHPDFRAGRVTFQDVARLALSRGIEQLKHEVEEERQE
jgi:hypothetical protein